MHLIIYTGAPAAAARLTHVYGPKSSSREKPENAEGKRGRGGNNMAFHVRRNNFELLLRGNLDEICI